MAKLNILELCHDLSLGGIERAMQEFALNIDRSRFNVLVAVFDDSGPRKKILQDAGVEVVKVTEKSLPGLVRDRKIDVVHSHTIHMKKFIGDTLNIQEVVFSGGYALDADINVFISKSLALKTSTCIDIKYGRDFYVLYYPQNVAAWDRLRLPQKEISGARAKLGFGERDFVIGRIGRPEPSKTDYLVLASAGKIARRIPRARFLFVGMPLLFRVFLSLKPSLWGKAVFLKETPDDAKIAKFYQSIDAFWHTASWGETFGNVNAEAMVFEKPVVTHSTPFRGGDIEEHMDNAQIEVVDHLKTGLIASYPEDVAKAFEMLSGNSKLVRNLGIQGRRKVLAEYDSRIIVRQFERLAQALVLRKRPAILPSSEEVRDYFKKGYKTRLSSSISCPKVMTKARYRMARSFHNAVSAIYLIKRYLLRKILGLDLEKFGYRKYDF